MNLKNKAREGFTLIELLVVIGIIGILAGIVLVAVNPGRQFAQARNTARQSDLIQITNAIYQFAAEHNGNLPDTDGVDTTSNFPAVATCIGNIAPCFDLAVATNAAGLETIVPTYVAGMPMDPSIGIAGDIGYTITVANSRITASAPNAELGAVISVTR